MDSPPAFPEKKGKKEGEKGGEVKETGAGMARLMEELDARLDAVLLFQYREGRREKRRRETAPAHIRPADPPLFFVKKKGREGGKEEFTLSPSLAA